MSKKTDAKRADTKPVRKVGGQLNLAKKKDRKIRLFYQYLSWAIEEEIVKSEEVVGDILPKVNKNALKAIEEKIEVGEVRVEELKRKWEIFSGKSYAE